MLSKSMRADSLKTFFRTFIAVVSIFIYSQTAFGQSNCLTPEEVKNLIARLGSQQNASLNNQLQTELLKMRDEVQTLRQKLIEDGYQDSSLKVRLKETREKNAARFCQILKEFGWPSKNLVGSDGTAAAFFIFKDSPSFEFQKELLPLISQITEKGEIPKSELAALIDLVRARAGMKQLFGTIAVVIDGWLVLYPIQDEMRVDERRSKYELSSLASYLKFLEKFYKMPLIKSPTVESVSSPDVQPVPSKQAGTVKSLETQTGEDEEIVRIETNLVNLNVSVYSRNLKLDIGALEKKDFVVFEDGHEESITFFAATDVPFDLVLLLDLSGSTSKKRDLIRKTTQRFIESARPSDRIAVVTFADTTNVISPLAQDRAKLLESAKKIDGTGGSNVWDAIKYSLDEVVGPKTLERRRAIVIMSDGVDASLPSLNERGSDISFADLLETVRRNDTLIIPIYLDTEPKDIGPNLKKAYEHARKTLTLLAEESGGLFYKARKVEDLNGVYEQVLNDLGKVYSLGYQPTNEKRDGSWRTLKIQIPNRPDLSVRSRRGYYAN